MIKAYLANTLGFDFFNFSGFQDLSCIYYGIKFVFFEFCVFEVKDRENPKFVVKVIFRAQVRYSR